MLNPVSMICCPKLPLSRMKSLTIVGDERFSLTFLKNKSNFDTKPFQMSAKSLKRLVSATGFEPVTR